MADFDKLKDYLEGSYSHTEHCRNCGHPNMLSIPKGTSIAHYMQGKPCSNCGVSLRKSPYDRKPDVWMEAKS